MLKSNPAVEAVHPPLVRDEAAVARQGLLYGIGAYGLWGLIPLYFRTIREVPALEILAQRIVWSCLLLVILSTLLGRWKEAVRALRSRQVMTTLAASSLLIAANWYVYIHAVETGQVLQSSLGYFITPLLNVLLGVVFFGERLRTYQLFAIVLAVVGVAILVLLVGQVPWIALFLAVSFALYGLARKTVPVDGLLGLLIETLLMAGPALLYVIFVETGREAGTGWDPQTRALLCAGGVVTAVPLLMFAGAARRLRMATLGILQYLAPTLQFFLAVFSFGEPFSNAQLASFTCIWAAVLLYTADSLRSYHQLRKQDRPAPGTGSSDAIEPT